MNAVEINERYDVTRYEDEQAVILVLNEMHKGVHVSLVELLAANGMELKQTNIMRVGAIMVEDNLIALGGTKPQERKVALRWEKKTDGK